MFFMGALVLIAVWAMDDLRAAARAWFEAPSITHSCQRPSPVEQLHVVRYWHDGRLRTECLYVGTRGSYTRRTVRQAAAQ